MALYCLTKILTYCFKAVIATHILSSGLPKAMHPSVNVYKAVASTFPSREFAVKSDMPDKAVEFRFRLYRAQQPVQGYLNLCPMEKPLMKKTDKRRIFGVL